MKALKGLVVLVAAFSLWGCEMDDVNFQDFLNDMTVNMDDGEDDAVCGDGRLDPGEECDDGNTWDRDGCSSYCTWEEIGCYDWYGWYHLPGEMWMPSENEECICYGDGSIECWGWDYPDPDIGCTTEDGVFYPVGETVPMPDGKKCICIDWDVIDCDGEIIAVII